MPRRPCRRLPPTRPYLGAQFPASVTVPEENKGTFGHWINAPREPRPHRASPAAPRHLEQPGAAPARRGCGACAGPSRPGSGRGAGVAACPVGVPPPLGLALLIVHPGCAPSHPSAQSLCPQRDPSLRAGWPHGAAGPEGCTRLWCNGCARRFCPHPRGLLGTRYLERSLDREVHFAKPRFTQARVIEVLDAKYPALQNR